LFHLVVIALGYTVCDLAIIIFTESEYENNFKSMIIKESRDIKEDRSGRDRKIEKVKKK